MFFIRYVFFKNNLIQTQFLRPGSWQFGFLVENYPYRMNVQSVCRLIYRRRFKNNTVFGHNSLPQALIGTRIGGNGSYQPPGAP